MRASNSQPFSRIADKRPIFDSRLGSAYHEREFCPFSDTGPSIPTGVACRLLVKFGTGSYEEHILRRLGWSQSQWCNCGIVGTSVQQGAGFHAGTSEIISGSV